MSRVAVIGAGYVGLATTALLVQLGNDVSCADILPERVAMLNRGEIPILEDGIAEVVHDGLAAGRLRFVLGAEGAVGDREFVFLCLQTPEREDGSADLSYVVNAATAIGPHLAPGAIVISKSTVPVGSIHVVREALGRSDVAVASNPEFLREGFALYDCRHPDRLVIGADDPQTAEAVAGLFKDIDAPVVLTDPISSETIKYASNAFLAAKISFANSMANLCEAVGADVADVLAGMGYDHRIGDAFLLPGPGWGGSCLPKDTTALARIARDAGYPFELLETVMAVNKQQQARVVAKIAAAVGGSLDGQAVAVWGLTFKAGTGDRRQSPALGIIAALSGAGARVQAYDPTVTDSLEGMTVCGDAYAACEGAAVLAVLTEWPEFAGADFDKVRSLLAQPSIVDARNLLDRDRLRASGFQYQGIGR